MAARETPSCDVVIPARNAAAWVAAAVTSVLDQTLEATRIILVADRSTDGTAAVAASFGGRVHLVRGEGRTAAAARNLGVRHSESELVAFLDADDLCHRERLADQVEALVDNPEAALAFCDAEYVDAAGRPSGSVFTCPEFSSGAFLGQLFERNRLLSASVAMVRRHAFDAAGGFTERLSHAEDYDLWLRLATMAPVAHVPRSLVSYRLHGNNLSADQSAHHRSEVAILLTHDRGVIQAALLRAHGNQARADLALSGVLFRMERYDEGELLLRRTHPVERDRALRHFMLGNFAVKRGDLPTAANEFSLCLELEGTWAPALNNLGVIAAAGGRLEEARGWFHEAERARAGYGDPHRNLDSLGHGHTAELRYTLAPLRPVLRPDL